MADKTKNLKPPWKKGQSGNPNGRQPNTSVREWLAEIIGEEEAEKLLAATKKKGRGKVKDSDGELMPLTKAERDKADRMIPKLSPSILKAIIKNGNTPVYVAGRAVGVLFGLQEGKTDTLDKMEERQFGKDAQRIELTGADGESLGMQPFAVEIIDRREQVRGDTSEDGA